MVDVATVTGVIGALTGVAALLVSIGNHSRVNAMKSLDLRLEVGRTFDNLDILMSGLEDYLEFVRQSRIRVLAAIGLANSGAHQAFEADFEDDKRRLRTLLSTQPKRESSYDTYSPEQLESLLTSTHSFQVQISEIRAKYQSIFEADEERRKEIRARYP